ncbi:ABC transporter permease [Plantactinospora sp. S1510]|uniref:ABC transporter permease n=1 Tax=Plantactinospora alkalitolerans TaxID=2789879 RepID=A0ABS0GRJ6_9ACTN|nr:ABC transporter permease [Plantactinospora alkalitolerans]MBF9128827.1 ABC transporter permease [Plantactinospora alkalitolerans]
MDVLDARWFRLLTKLAVFAAALGTWQLLTTTGALPTDSFPTMVGTMTELGRQLGSSDLWLAVGQTLRGWALGLLIGGSLAIATGTLLGLNRFAYRSVIPVIEFLKTVPVIAILPLAVVVFGPTPEMKIFLVAFGVFWPLTIQAIYGARAVDPVIRDTATVMQVRGVRRFAMVTLPSAAPFLATGVRVAAAVGLILAVIAELIGGSAGLGLSVLTAENAGPSQLPAMYSFIIVTGILGVVVTAVFTAIERRLLHWHESQRNAASRAA